MAKPENTVSTALLTAQQRLQSLREKRRVERPKTSAPATICDHGRFPLPVTSRQYPVSSKQLPDHLGWGNGAITAVLRKHALNDRQGARSEEYAASGKWPIDDSPIRQSKPSPTEASTIKLYPDIALGMLRQELTAAGRIWLLLKHIDNVGRGWTTFDDAREKLTSNESTLRVCGWRQLRNLLSRGDGIFWTRDNGRIWLRSVAKVAAAMEVRQLKLQPVALPVAALLEGIGQVRAHLYASFHSSRGKRDAEAAPIARETLARISHVPKRTQRFYELRANVKAKRNFAVGPQTSDSELETQAWQHGAALFQLNDSAGQHGRKGRTYLAWQLPNNYSGPHAKQPRGRMKRINQELADLFMKGMTGNDEKMVEDKQLPMRFFGNGRLAAKDFNQSTNQNIYWKRVGGLRQAQSTGYQAQSSSYQLWYVLSKGEE